MTSLPALAPAGVAAVDRRRDPGEGWVGWVLMALVVATPFLAYLGNLSFAPAVALAGLLCARFALRKDAPWLALAVLAVGAAWAAASMAWSPFHPPPAHRFKDLQQITAAKLGLQLLLYGALLAAVDRVGGAVSRRLLRVGAVALAALSILLLIEAFDGARVYQAIRIGAHVASSRVDWAERDLARAAYVLALLYWPAALVLWRRGMSWAAAALFVATFVSGLVLHVDSPLAALVLSGVAFALVRYNGSVGVWVTAAGVFAYVLLTPVVVHLAAPLLNVHALSGGIAKASWGDRLQIWAFVDRLIGQKPWLGWGLDASRAWPGVIPLHPHDGALQVRLNRRDPGVAAAACGAICAYVVIGALSFGVWQEWWLALGALAAVWVMLLDRSDLDAGASALPSLRTAD